MRVADNVIQFNRQRHSNVRVERQVNAGKPNRTAYRITGMHSVDVQEQIDALVAEVEMHGRGYGRFIGPHHIGHGCYVALGEIIITKETPV